MKYQMTHDEMRMIRRELINNCIHSSLFRLQDYKLTVRQLEVKRYGQQLKVYQAAKTS